MTDTTTDAGHTPGPWKIRYGSRHDNYPYQIYAPNGNHGPGGIRDVTRWASISMPSSQEGQANARLIAAAPELLEALRIDDVFQKHGLTKTALRHLQAEGIEPPDDCWWSTSARVNWRVSVKRAALTAARNQQESDNG